MNLTRLTIAAALTVAAFTCVASPALASGPDVYTTNQAGYQLAGDTLTLQYAQATFTVPSNTTGLGLVGVSMTNYKYGGVVVCGLLLSEIGCSSNGSNVSPGGWQVMIPASDVSAGNRVMVTMHYYPATGLMKLHADDITTGHAKTITDGEGYKNIPWSQVFDGVNIDNATIPGTAQALTISSFSNVSATTTAGKTITLTPAQPVIDTVDGTSGGAVVAGPTSLTGTKAFQVVEQPTA